jgi:hypothetical protein
LAVLRTVATRVGLVLGEDEDKEEKEEGPIPPSGIVGGSIIEESESDKG